MIGDLSRATSRLRAAALSRDLRLKRAGRERSRQAAAPFDLLEGGPSPVAQRACQRLESAGAGGRIGDKSEMGFAQEDELAIAGETPREAIGKSDGERVGQDADAVGAAETGGKGGDRAAHHVHIRVARGHHAPRAFRLDVSPSRLEPAGLLDRCPGEAEGSEFRQRDELVGVGREAKGDHGARLLEPDARVLERAQESDRGAERKTELLRRRSARRVDRARVGDDKRPGEAHRAQDQRRVDMSLEALRPIGGKWPARRRREGVEPEGDGAVGRAGARSLDEAGEGERFVGAVAAEIEFDAQPRVEAHAFEGRVQGRRIGLLQAISVGADRSGEDDLQPVRSAHEILMGLGVGLARVGMVEPRDDAPRSAWTERARTLRRRIERLDPDSVGAPEGQGLEARPLQGGFGGPAPVRFAPGWKNRQLRAQRRDPQMNCDRPGIEAEISPTVWSPATSRA